MFYSKFMFVKKGPLAKVWIAAHFHRKLNKAHVQGTDINLSVKSILDPATPLALRLSGQLLLGLVRIFQRKVKYLQEDCSEALTKMKMIFRPGAVDLPPEASVAPVAQITIPDNFDKIDYAIPDIPLENLDEMVMVHEDWGGSRSQSITMPEIDVNLQLGDDFGFGLGADLLDDMPDAGRGSKKGESSDLSDVEKARRGTPGPVDDIPAEDGKIEFEGKAKQKLDRSKDDSMLRPGNISGMETTTDGEVPDGGAIPSDLEPDRSRVVDDAVAPPSGDADSGTPAPTAEGPGVEPESTTVDGFKVPLPKPKKRRVERDSKTELPGVVINKQLHDTSDIVAPRVVAALSKRAKLTHQLHKTGVDSLLRNPLFADLHDLDLPFAPELLAIFDERERVWSHPEAEATVGVAVEEEQQQREEEELGKEADKEEQHEQENKEDVKAKKDKRKSREDKEELKEKPQDQPEQEGEWGAAGMPDMPDMGDISMGLPMGGDVTVDTSVGPAHDIDSSSASFSPSKACLDTVEELFKETGSEVQANSNKKQEDVEYGWSVRSKNMHQLLLREFKAKPKLSFEAMVEHKPRKISAAVFYQLLVLKTHGCIEVEQPGAYSDIALSQAA